MKYLFILLAAAMLQLAFGQFPDYLEPCSQSDPDIEQCIINNANKALPILLAGVSESNIPVFEELQLPTFDYQVSPELHFLLSDGTSFASQDLRVTKATWNFESQHVTMDFEASILDWDIAFLATGTVLGAEVQEKGRANFTFFDIDFKYEADYTVLTIDGIECAQMTHGESSSLTTNFNFAPHEQESVGAPMSDEQHTEFLKISQGIVDHLKEDARYAAFEIVNSTINNVLRTIPFEQLFLP